MGQLLRQAAAERTHGRWELLATAAGVASSVTRTAAVLSRTSIERSERELVASPSSLSDRVEALAAHDPRLLARVAEEWVEPAEIDGSHWWTSAWTTALRHLDGVGALDPDRVRVPELLGELELIRPPVGPRVSWHRLAELVREDAFAYQTVRRHAADPLAEAAIARDDIDAVPFVMLRLLRGRATLLDDGGRRRIAEMARRALDGDPLQGTLAVELSIELGYDTDDLERRVTERLRLAEPRDVEPLCYVLLGAWRLP